MCLGCAWDVFWGVFGTLLVCFGMLLGCLWDVGECSWDVFGMRLGCLHLRTLKLTSSFPKRARWSPMLARLEASTLLIKKRAREEAGRCPWTSSAHAKTSGSLSSPSFRGRSLAARIS